MGHLVLASLPKWVALMLGEHHHTEVRTSARLTAPISMLTDGLSDTRVINTPPCLTLKEQQKLVSNAQVGHV